MRHLKIILSFFILFMGSQLLAMEKKKLAYVVSDISIPFWDIMSKGMKNSAQAQGYELVLYNGENSAKKELEMTIKAIKDGVDGIMVSPTNSSACVTIIKLARAANIPVVVSDVGSDSKDYISYISSNNFQGAYDVGKVLSEAMHAKKINDGSVGIIAIPQKRLNGQARTSGFMKALDEAKIKGADIKQFITWDDKETYTYVMQMIKEHANLKAIWLQTSNMYKGAINALNDAKKADDILLIAFDAEPEFLELIPKGVIIGSGMQQPFLMGEVSAKTLISHLKGEKVAKDIQLPILVVSTQTINERLTDIQRNVLGK